jgi:hypothetical protein
MRFLTSHFIILITLVFFACDNTIKNSNNATDKESSVNLGSRLIVIADVNADGILDTLKEKFISQQSGNEVSKMKDTTISYDEFLNYLKQQQPHCYMSTGNKVIDSLPISSAQQLLGLLFIKNEGDLNGDGGDEISYVINWADQSNRNECILVTYKENRWVELCRFDIFETMVPELPGSVIETGPFGTKLITTNSNEFIDEQIKQYQNFKGLIRKKAKGKIEVNTLDFESIDIWKTIELNS